MKLKLNENILRLKESATLAINLKAKAARKAGRDICHLGFGQSPFHVHEKIVQALAENAHQKDYLPTKGLPELCEKIAEYHNRKFDYHFSKDRILVAPGSKELLFQALYLLEGPVFVPAPSWVSYGPQVNIKGQDIHAIQTCFENQYKMTALELEAACQKYNGEEQKILILNSPSNPTGALYHEDEIKSLAAVCREHNVIVIADEIYALINFSDQKFASFHHHYPEGTLVTSGLSKAHAAGGYRLGFLYVPEGFDSLIKGLCAMISETFSAVAAPIQYAALAAYDDDADIDAYIANCSRIHKVCGHYLHQRFVKMGLLCNPPEGAFYLFPSFAPHRDKLAQKGITNDVELVEKLFDEVEVAVLPGSDFYHPSESLCVRVASVDYNGQEVYQQALQKTELDSRFVEENCPQLGQACDRLAEFITC